MIKRKLNIAILSCIIREFLLPSASSLLSFFIFIHFTSLFDLFIYLFIYLFINLFINLLIHWVMDSSSALEWLIAVSISSLRIIFISSFIFRSSFLLLPYIPYFIFRTFVCLFFLHVEMGLHFGSFGSTSVGPRRMVKFKILPHHFTKLNLYTWNVIIIINTVNCLFHNCYAERISYDAM